MGHGHHHAPLDRPTARRKLVIATVATGLFVVFELAVGLYANALALVGDALHNVTDLIALLLALFAITVETRPPTPEKTFGYQRAGILAAFVNAAVLVAFTIYIFIEAFERLRRPEPVNSFWMIVASVIGIGINAAITLWLREEGRADINVRSAVLHMFGDTLSSAGIIVAAILIRVTGRTIFDPLVSVVIGLLILWSSWGILKESINLLLEGTPSGIDPEAVARDLAAQEEIFDVHHVHIWALAPSKPALSCHVQLDDISLSASTAVLLAARRMLSERYGIVHTTIQFEHAGCSEDDPFCLLPGRNAKREPDARD